MSLPNKQLRVAIVNRNYPPRVGVTGESACRLARYLEANHGTHVTVVSTRSNYAGGGSLLDPAGEVRLVRSWYDGKNKLLRLFSSFFESYFLIKSARSRKPDRVIVMTDPPFLQFWAAILLAGKCPWTLWSMDVFPDAFVAGNLVSSRNPAYRFLKYLTYRKAPQSLIALGPLQAQYLKDAYLDPIDSVSIIPCGVYQKLNEPTSKPAWKEENSEKIIIGYCGNIGEAHSVEFLKQVISHFDRERFHLVLAVYGVRAEEILRFAKEKEGISFLPRVEREQMHFIDIHLVSLLKNWSHVCVPSKAVSAICSGSPILFYGTPDCDNWEMLGEGGWLIHQSESKSQVSQSVKRFFDSVDSEALESKKQGAINIATDLQRMIRLGFDDLADQINYTNDQIELYSADLLDSETGNGGSCSNPKELVAN